MLCTIHWLDLPINIRKEYFQKVNNANLLQSDSYINALVKLQSQKSRYGLIKIDGKDAGIVWILEAGFLRNMLHAVILDRGPLWFGEYGSEKHFQGFCTALRHEFPKRLGRVMRFIPEMECAPQIDEILKKHGFHKKSAGYQTIVLDLTQDEQALRADLRKNWLGSLKKAEKAGLQIEWDDQGLYLEECMKSYSLDKKKKGYNGPDVNIIRAVAEKSLPFGETLIARAHYQEQLVGTILIFCHGRTATYQIGWNTQDGREYGAHNFLLWQAVLYLKENGFTAFDLGGINDTEAKNVKKFKEGMGGRLVALPGLYT